MSNNISEFKIENLSNDDRGTLCMSLCKLERYFENGDFGKDEQSVGPLIFDSAGDKTISIIKLFCNYVDYYNTEITIDKVSPYFAGKTYAYFAFPPLERMMNGCDTILFDHNSYNSHPKTVIIFDPNPFSSSVFSILGEEIARHVNRTNPFCITLKATFGLPWILCDATKKLKIRNNVDFKEWVALYNSIVENEEPIFYWGKAREPLDVFDLSALYIGTDEELHNIPRTTMINVVRRDINDGYGGEHVVSVKMIIDVDADNIIHIKCSTNEICKIYDNDINNDLKNYVNPYIGLYTIVNGALFNEVQFLVKQKYIGASGKSYATLVAYDYEASMKIAKEIDDAEKKNGNVSFCQESLYTNGTTGDDYFLIYWL